MCEIGTFFSMFLYFPIVINILFNLKTGSVQSFKRALSHSKTSIDDWHTHSKQSHGTVGFGAFLYAFSLWDPGPVSFHI